MTRDLKYYTETLKELSWILDTQPIDEEHRKYLENARLFAIKRIHQLKNKEIIELQIKYN